MAIYPEVGLLDYLVTLFLIFFLVIFILFSTVAAPVYISINSAQSCFFYISFPIFPGGSDGKASARNAGDPGWISGLGRSLGEGNGNPLQYSCLENSMDRGAWWATVHGVTKSRTQLSDFMTQLRSSVYCWFINLELTADSTIAHA